MTLVNTKKMMQDAFNGGYAVPHVNMNNLEWAKAILTTAQELNSPIIVGASEGAIKYMGGYNVVAGIVKGMIKDLNITVPVAMHLDHGSLDGVKKAIEAGFSSVMFDGSHFPFEENFAKSQEVMALANPKDISVELEVGTLGGEEDGIIGNGDLADPEEVKKMATLNPSMIAAGINNIHGPYPPQWKSLDFDVLSKLKEAAGRPIVLHGGSGIPEEQVKKCIELGVGKVNVNTELQLANAEAIREFVRSGKSDEGKNYDPRKFLAPGYQAMKLAVKEKIELFGSVGKV